MNNVRWKIEVRGVVQGVGFRPFVYNAAAKLKLAGIVFNSKKGVEIEIEGSANACQDFIAHLEKDPPPLARIDQVASTRIEPKGETGFTIVTSHPEGAEVPLISKDWDVCTDCLREMMDAADRRHRYPFINCTNCGPRYTLITKAPYDRPYTSMAGFPMCPDCQREYDDPTNRRFHAQPNACPVCGPRLTLRGAAWEEIECADHIGETARLLREGKILAIKGVGGYHFACDARNGAAVDALRERKMRKDKPLAVMSNSIDDIAEYANLSGAHSSVLLSRKKPIVLVNKKSETALAEGIAPGLREFGVFLPYTPVQHLLFAANAPAALVMTSGNISDEPIVFTEEEMAERLGGIADFYLTHNRPIVWRCDDPVIRIVGDHAMILRRSRGFVPVPVQLAKEVARPILACGGDLKNVFCLAKGENAFLGPHIGDLVNAEANRNFRESIEHFKGLFGIMPELVAVDMHPRYQSSEYGRRLGLPVVEVQHHHAHIASVMLENRVEGEVIGVALDGTGYGPDGTIWGGEILACSYAKFQRLGHFPALKLPGGDKAAKEPWRVATALLYETFGDGFKELLPAFAAKVGEKKIDGITGMVDAGLNCPLSTGAGRWFDAVASILMVRQVNAFEGQAPMMLESIADPSEEGVFPFGIGEDGTLQFDHMVRELACMGETEAGRGAGAAKFHNTIALAVAESCVRARNITGLNDVCLGGGSFQNALLLKKLEPLLTERGFKMFLPRQVPINDGGLALGQLAVTMANPSWSSRA